MANLFFSYSHRDEDLRNELEKHLAMLRRDGTITTWHDRRITAGSDLDATITAELEQAQIILLLVSANFLDSQYCYEREMQRAMEMHEEGTATVIPVILKPCDWKPALFGKLLAVPTDGKAVTMYANQDEAFTMVAQAVRQAADKHNAALRTSPLTGTPTFVEQISEKPVLPDRSSNLRVKRTFDDHEVDQFRENSFEYLARFFERSLLELQERNPQIKTQFKRVDANSFTAMIYKNGKREGECFIVLNAVGGFGSNGITYCRTAGMGMNSFNEILTVGNDGFTLHLVGGGFHSRSEPMTQHGAAELYWSLLVGPMQ